MRSQMGPSLSLPSSDNPGETGKLVLVKDELRTVGEPVLREASGRSFVEFHEGFDVVE